MRVLVCGDRNWSPIHAQVIEARLAKLPSDTIVLHGNCRGADKMAGEAAEALGLEIEIYPAEWARYGRAAGPIRNHKMLDTGVGLVLAFHNNLMNSRGTRDTVYRAEDMGIKVEICTS